MPGLFQVFGLFLHSLSWPWYASYGLHHATQQGIHLILDTIYLMCLISNTKYSFNLGHLGIFVVFENKFLVNMTFKFVTTFFKCTFSTFLIGRSPYRVGATPEWLHQHVMGTSFIECSCSFFFRNGLLSLYLHSINLDYRRRIRCFSWKPYKIYAHCQYTQCNCLHPFGTINLNFTLHLIKSAVHY